LKCFVLRDMQETAYLSFLWCFSEERREKREERKDNVSALCNQHIGKSRMSAHR